jgi:hypothetical protein
VSDVFKWNLFLATDVIGELAFGESFRMLQFGKAWILQHMSRVWIGIQTHTNQ